MHKLQDVRSLIVLSTHEQFLILKIWEQSVRDNLDVRSKDIMGRFDEHGELHAYVRGFFFDRRILRTYYRFVYRVHKKAISSNSIYYRLKCGRIVEPRKTLTSREFSQLMSIYKKGGKL